MLGQCCCCSYCFEDEFWWCGPDSVKDPHVMNRLLDFVGMHYTLEQKVPSQAAISTIQEIPQAFYLLRQKS